MTKLWYDYRKGNKASVCRVCCDIMEYSTFDKYFYIRGNKETMCICPSCIEEMYKELKEEV